jgi:hypothetical protein
MAVGYASGSNPDWPGGEVARSLVRFDTPSTPPDMSISKATMHLKHTATSYQNDGSRTVTTYRAEDSWGELSANWDNQPGQAEAYGAASVSVTPGEWYAFDVTGLVQGWASGSFPNYGLILRGPESPDDIVLFQFQSHDTSGTDSDPYLVVTYTSVPSNTPPIISGLPNQQLSVNDSADDAIDLWTYADDAEDADDELTFSICNAPDPGAGVALDANRYIDIYPTDNWSGTTDVEIQVVDTGGLTDTDSFQVAVGVAAGAAQGIFVDSGQLLGSSFSGAVVLGDLDGDGDLDAFVGNYNPSTDEGQADKVWLNNGGLQGGTLGTYTGSGQSLGTARSRGVALGDLDGDGDLDAFVANGGAEIAEPNTVWLNDGTGVFSATQGLGDYNSQAVGLADLDGDDDLDAFVANWAHADRVWLNDGSGAFSATAQYIGYPPGAPSLDVALGDLDKDGDVDAIVATWIEWDNPIWLNDGTGLFAESGHNLGTFSINDVELGDVDGDGDLDAVGATDMNATRVWRNDGTGSFTDTSQSLGSLSSGAITLGDVDGDGDLDAFIDNEVWLNDGTGAFSPSEQNGASGYTLSQSIVRTAALGDVDRDGDLDAFGGLEGPNRVWLNRNAFRVTQVSPRNAAVDVAAGAIVSATLDLLVDSSSVSTHTFAVRGSQTGVYTGAYTSDPLCFDAAMDFKPGEEIWINLSSGIRSMKGTALLPYAGGTALVPYAWGFRAATGAAPGTFFDSGQLLGSSFSGAVVLGDLDGDGDLDAFVGNYNPSTDEGQADKVWLNNGGLQGGTLGTYTGSGQSLGTARSRGVALGDLDGDGDLDAFVANGGAEIAEPNTVWLNDGTGVFSATQGLGDYNSQAVGLADLDGDGDLDAFVANWASTNLVWLNDGEAVFVNSGQLMGASASCAALGDVDGDGDVDAVTGISLAYPNGIWLNDGLGVFVKSSHGLGTFSINDIELGDVDGDSDLDAVAATDMDATRVWNNDGSGAFTDSGQSLGSLSSGAVTLGDVDGDGDLDALVDIEVWLNDGTGAFSASGHDLSSLDAQALALGDVDGDGDLDAFGGIDGPNKVWLNRKVYRIYLPIMLKSFGL